MGKNSAISWTDHTFSPWWGCDEVPEDPACSRCYAREFSRRLLGENLWGENAPRKINKEHYWNEPFRWDRAAAKVGVKARVFCASMSDILENRRDLDPWRAKLWPIVEATPNVTWLFLTKRHDNYVKMLPPDWLRNPRPNVWLGVTAATQKWADVRIPVLLSVPAVCHWISAEPLIGPINFTSWFAGYRHDVTDDGLDAPDGAELDGEVRSGDQWIRTKGLDWIVVGGESGLGARRMDPGWARDILDQCRRSNVAFHFKQKGNALAKELGCKNREGKDASEWPDDLRIQEFPKVA